MPILPVLTFASATSITPGPNNLMLLNSSLNFGFRRSLPHFLGILSGFPVMIFILALGLGKIFLLYPWLKLVLKFAGASYMLYLCYTMTKPVSGASTSTERQPFRYWQAVLFQWVNPKAWIMGIGITSLFQLHQDIYINALMLSLIYLVIGIPCGSIWLCLGSAMKRLLNSPKQLRLFNIIMAVALAATIIYICFE